MKSPLARLQYMQGQFKPELQHGGILQHDNIALTTIFYQNRSDILPLGSISMTIVRAFLIYFMVAPLKVRN